MSEYETALREDRLEESLQRFTIHPSSISFRRVLVYALDVLTDCATGSDTDVYLKYHRALDTTDLHFHNDRIRRDYVVRCYSLLGDLKIRRCVKHLNGIVSNHSIVGASVRAAEIRPRDAGESQDLVVVENARHGSGLPIEGDQAVP